MTVCFAPKLEAWLIQGTKISDAPIWTLIPGITATSYKDRFAPHYYAYSYHSWMASSLYASRWTGSTIDKLSIGPAGVRSVHKWINYDNRAISPPLYGNPTTLRCRLNVRTVRACGHSQLGSVGAVDSGAVQPVRSSGKCRWLQFYDRKQRHKWYEDRTLVGFAGSGMIMRSRGLANHSQCHCKFEYRYRLLAL